MWPDLVGLGYGGRFLKDWRNRDEYGHTHRRTNKGGLNRKQKAVKARNERKRMKKHNRR